MLITALLLTAAAPASVSTGLTCAVIDGDGLRCAGENIRLLGIDAPELHGCRPKGRKCVAGDGKASKAALARLVKGKRVRIERHGKDRHGRTLAFAYVGRVNLSCAQINAGHGVYVARWDVGNGVGRCVGRRFTSK